MNVTSLFPTFADLKLEYTYTVMEIKTNWEIILSTVRSLI